MVKVSISLPNNALITFESEESEVLREIVGMALRDLPRDLMQPGTTDATGGAMEKSTSVTDVVRPAATITEPPPSPISQPAKPNTQSVTVAVPPITARVETNDTGSIPPEFLSTNGRAAFEAFCQEANPLGDMRRGVVAAEGAIRHFGVDGVNADELGWLFDSAGWRRPGNFTQTLRNAARSKFGWLERIPGRSGRYAATPLGLSKTIPRT